VVEHLRQLLGSRPPSSYSAAASEVLRVHQFRIDRASVRRWAIRNHLAPDTRHKKVLKPIRRWQVQERGALWQYDASPHAWLPRQRGKSVLLNLLDDATRFNVAVRLYEREILLAHFEFLSRAFLAHGLPLALYVDYHSFFFTHTPDAFTQLGEALHFYGVTLRYAPTPQAKGKIERRHDYWQRRLPPLLAAHQIDDLESANTLLDQLLPHANEQEIHRELGMTPHAAWTQARAQKRCVLRPAPRCPWWPFVWSVRTGMRVGDDGKVAVGTQRLTIEAPRRSRVIRCLRPDGDIYVLKEQPQAGSKPVVLLHCPIF
jgi:hypothetical protein